MPGSPSEPPFRPATARQVGQALRDAASAARAASLARFFKTGPGQYGEGDRFLGVMVPALRRIARAHAGLPLREQARLLRSPFHEERLVALMILVGQFSAALDDATRKRLFTFYMKQLPRIDNWDLVDASAAPIVGAWLERRPRGLLTRLARSQRLWSRRVAIIATHHLIRRGEAGETLRIARRLLQDPHDLIHKAVGWMLREVGKHQGPAVLRGFLRQHAPAMPATMLRYAIEHFEPAERARWRARRRS